MFEKCGLKDIFCGFLRSKWIILAVIVIFGGIGCVKYLGDLKSYNIEKAKAEQNVVSGYAYYYLSGSEDAPLAENTQAKWLANCFIDLMRSVPSREAILNSLKKNHSDDELTALMGADTYKNGVSRFSIWENGYQIERWTSNRILKLTTIAADRNMCKELMDACNDRLMAISKSVPDASLTYEGRYFRTVKRSSVTEGAAQPAKPRLSSLLLWIVIGIAAGLLISVIRSIIFPVLNRASDFELYGTTPIGEVSKKTLPLLARILNKAVEEDGKHIVFATSLKNGKKLESFCSDLCREWQALGRNVSLDGEESKEGKILLSTAVSPDRNAAASDLCETADMVYVAEWKGRSLHVRYDEMCHYLELIRVKNEGVILMA